MTIKLFLILYHFAAYYVCFCESNNQFRALDRMISGVRSKTQYMDLNWDCQQLIFEKLDFESLISVSQVNKELNLLASEVFRRRYISCNSKNGINRVHINPMKHGNTDIEGNQLWEIANGILKLHPNLVEGFLKSFGHFIYRLLIEFDTIPSNKHGEFGYLINHYCSDTLLELKERGADQSFYNVMEKPFKRVNAISFKADFRESNVNLMLHELFPEVQHLHLRNWHHYTYESPLAHHISNLNTLEMYTCGLNQLNTFIPKTPHIRSLSCVYVDTSSIFQHVNTYLPEIEYLKLNIGFGQFFKLNESETYSDIHLKHVKELTFEIDCRIDNFIEYSFENLNERLTFDKLEMLTFGAFLNGHHKELGEFVNFISNHRNIHTFIMKFGYVNETTFQQLTTILNNLVNATIIYHGHIDIQSILTFLEANKKMENFHYRFLTNQRRRLDSVIINAMLLHLSNKLGRNWIISFNADYDMFSLLRKDLNETVVDDGACSEINFEGWKLIDLLKKANINSDCIDLTTKAFTERYSMKTFAIHSPKPSSEPIITDYTALDTVHIYDVESTFNLLKNFGHLITKLSVSYVDASEYREINDLIGKHCSESLTEIHFASFEGNMWSNITEPFNNVRKLTIGRTIEKLENEMMKIEALFPNTEELYLHSIESFDDTFIKMEFPLLVDLSIKFAPYTGSSYLKPSNIGSLLKQNSQIRALEVNDAEIIDYLDGSEQLEKIIIKKTFLSDTTLNTLTSLCSKYTNLRNVSLNCNEDVSDETLIKFIEDNEKLTTVQLKVHGYDTYYRIRKHFNEWNITQDSCEKLARHSIYIINMERLTSSDESGAQRIIEIVCWILYTVAPLSLIFACYHNVKFHMKANTFNMTFIFLSVAIIIMFILICVSFYFVMIA